MFRIPATSDSNTFDLLAAGSWSTIATTFAKRTTFWIASDRSSKELHLPVPLTLAGAGAILGAKLETLTPHAYRKLVGPLDVTGLNQKQEQEASGIALRSSHDDRKTLLDLAGGKASACLSGEGSDGIPELLRASTFRILLTWHLDGTVRFYDASSHLLLMGEADEDDMRRQSAIPRIWLQNGFPSPLQHLTINVRNLLQSPSMVGHASFDRARGRARVQDVDFAAEVLETTISLSTGQIVHFRYAFAQLSETEAIHEEVEESILREEAEMPALSIPPVHSPRSATRSSFSTHSPRSATRSSVSIASPQSSTTVDRSKMIDDEMSRAMKELGVEGSSSNAAAPPPQIGAPPPRPRRDPNRLSQKDASGFEAPLGPPGPAGSGFAPPPPQQGPSFVPPLPFEQDEIVCCNISPIRDTMDSSPTCWSIRCAERYPPSHRATSASWQ